MIILIVKNTIVRDGVGRDRAETKFFQARVINKGDIFYRRSEEIEYLHILTKYSGISEYFNC